MRNLFNVLASLLAVTLVHYKIWPASDWFPKIAIDSELLMWLDGLLLEDHLE